MARPENPSLIYLDTVAIVRTITKYPGYETVQEILNRAQSGRLQVAISMMSYVEVRGQGNSEAYDPAKDRQIIDLLDSPHLTRIEFFRAVALRARRYAREFNMKNPDAIHLASAAIGGAEVFMTWDMKKFPHGREIDGVWVDEPYLPGGDAPLPGF